MIYVVLIIPHLLAISGLLAFAHRTGVSEVSEDPYGGSDGDHGEQPPPRAPQPGPVIFGLQLANATPPRRRIQPGERLSHVHPRRLRREHALNSRSARRGKPRPAVGESLSSAEAAQHAAKQRRQAALPLCLLPRLRCGTDSGTWRSPALLLSRSGSDLQDFSFATNACAVRACELAQRQTFSVAECRACEATCRIADLHR